MKRSARHPSRRTFLESSVVLAAPWLVPASALGKAGRPKPSERLTMGLIGLGSMGFRHVKGFVQEADCQITHVCDVDGQRRDTVAAFINKAYRNTDCAKVHDFRELIGNPGVDTLVISVPDHWHSIPGILAARAGKDVYGEKPLALTIGEGRDMIRAVRRNRIVWQMGSWQRSTRQFRFGCELVRNDRVGKLQRVEVGIDRGPTCGPQPAMPVPKHFDYERWLGPAPWAPYTEKRCHWNFRWILDYSGGQVTDSGAHHIDVAHWGMGLDGTGPVAVEGVGKFPDDGLWDAAYDYQFACTYANGLTMHVGSNNHYAQGVRFVGEDGWVFVKRGKVIKAHPKSLLKERLGPDEIHLASPAEGHRQGHRRNFLDCVKTREEPITPIEVGHSSIAVAHLGNIAMLLGRRIRWDPTREVALDDDAANRMLRRAMREPWTY